MQFDRTIMPERVKYPHKEWCARTLCPVGESTTTLSRFTYPCLLGHFILKTIARSLNHRHDDDWRGDDVGLSAGKERKSTPPK